MKILLKKILLVLLIFILLILFLPFFIFLLINIFGFSLEPYLIKESNFKNLIIVFCFPVVFILIVPFKGIFDLFKKIVKFKLTLMQLLKEVFAITVLFAGALLLGFGVPFMTTLPVVSAFATIVIPLGSTQTFEDTLVIQHRIDPRRYRRYEATSRTDNELYKFQMPRRFGPQDDLTVGTTVKLKGIEGKLGRLITSYEVVKPAPAKN
jgi:hypothetical protein